MNIHIVAALLAADQELESIERSLKCGKDWRAARKIADTRLRLSRAMAHAQEGLRSVYADCLETMLVDQLMQQPAVGRTTIAPSGGKS
ncbi:MAG TPA: hypothetical protein VGH02_05260 [Rhizomicrobium sp.]|jgi:hypothetical protein